MIRNDFHGTMGLNYYKMINDWNPAIVSV